MLLLMRVAAWRKGFVVCGLAIVTYTAIASGTRSVFLAYGIGLLVFVALSLKSIRPSRLLQVGLAFVVAGSMVLYFAPIDSLAPAAVRFISLSGGLSEDASSLERIDTYGIAWNLFLQHPLQGIGDGGLIHFTQFGYPHNIILEVLTEFGVIGLFIFSFWFLFIFRESLYIRVRDMEVGNILIAIFVVVLVQHQVSFSIAMGRGLFLVSALLAAYGSGYRMSAKQRRPRLVRVPHYAPGRPRGVSGRLKA